MASITQTIPTYTGGISQQADHLKFPGQVRDTVNSIPDVTFGLFKRPGSERKGTAPLTNVYSNPNHATNKTGTWFHYFRDETEGSYVGQVDHDGNTRIWRCSDGQQMTVNYQNNSEAAIKSYLTATNPEDLQFLTINDSTFVTNRDVTNPDTVVRVNQNATWIETALGNTTAFTLPNHRLAVGDDVAIDFLTSNTSTPTDAVFKIAAVPNANSFTVTTTTNTARNGTCLIEPRTQRNSKEHFALVELTRTENGRQYGLNITNGTDDASKNVTLKVATRLKIKEHTLYEGNHSGHCAGIGTEVFSVSSGNSYVLPTASSSNPSSDTVTLNSDHGYEAGDPVIYHKVSATDTSNGIGGLENKREYYIFNVSTNSPGLVQLLEQDEDTSAHDLTDTAAPNSVSFTDATLGVVLDSSGNVVTDTSKRNLTFRITTLGQQGSAPGSSTAFRCSYSPDVTLLHGGEGWETGDQVLICMSSVDGGGGTGSGSVDERRAIYTLEVTDHEEVIVSGKYNGTDAGVIRPAPTPFDADTAVSADAILAGIATEIAAISGTPITTKVIGTSLYLESDTQFNIEEVEPDLMRIMQGSINDVTNLPAHCKHGYIVQVKNARMADEDDYYLRFEGQNGQDGVGAWSECAAPNISKRLYNMPLIIQRTSATVFEVNLHTTDFEYKDRRVGDSNTNPLPTFVTKRINKVLFFRNRLALLSGENVVMSRPGTLGSPDFFGVSALTISPSDPIDISSSSNFPSDLFDGIEINAGLLVFSSNQQFLLSTDDTVLNPDTAKLRSVSTYNYNVEVPPISLGTTIAYLDNSGKFSRLNEMANTAREGEPTVVESSKLVPSLLPKELNLLTNSRENSIILMGKENSDTVFGYKYFNIGDKRQQAAWFKWKFNNPLLYHFIINDEYFFVDSDNFLQCIKIIQSDLEPSITQDDVNYLIHLDNRVSISGGVYDSNTQLTTFSNVTWIPNVTTPNYDLVLVDTNEDAARVGRYAKVTMVQGSTTSFTVPGNWSSATLNIGYLYEYLVEFPQIFPVKTSGEVTRADINSSLILHRLKFHFGKIGLYETNLKRLGKADYPDVYDSALLNEYQVSDAPYLEEHIQTIPVYEKNENVEITLKSSHPAPATLRAVSWEGDFSPRFYKRV